MCITGSMQKKDTGKEGQEVCWMLNEMCMYLNLPGQSGLEWGLGGLGGGGGYPGMCNYSLC